MYYGYCKKFEVDVTPSECIRCENACPYLRDCEHLQIKSEKDESEMD